MPPAITEEQKDTITQPPPRDLPVPGSDKQSVLEAYGYQVSHTVGNGSYAVVKASYSTKYKCKVAIKIVQKNKAPRDYIEKFLPREIELIKVLRHPNLVCFLQSIETTNRVYLIMELAEGGDLLDVMNRQRYVKEPQAGNSSTTQPLMPLSLAVSPRSASIESDISVFFLMSLHIYQM